MNKILKRFLVYIITFLFVSLNAFPIVGNAVTGDKDSNEILNIKKTAEYSYDNKNDELNNREYNITLEASMKKKIIKEQKPKDVILVLDTSGSMIGAPANNLISSAKSFTQKLLSSSSKNRVSVITFAGYCPTVTNIGFHRPKYIYNGYTYDKYYRGEIDYDGSKDKTEILINSRPNSRYYYSNIHDGYINYGTKNQRKLSVEVGYGWRYVRVVSGVPSDSKVLTGFTSDSNGICDRLDKVRFGGGTNAQSAMGNVSKELETVNRDDSREKYVIFFTDGMPNMLITKNTGNMGDYIKETVKTFKNIEGENSKVKFISLGFKSGTLERDDEYSRAFLRGIQNYNNEIDPSSKDGVIYIDKPGAIEGIYNKIYNKIIMNVQDAKIVDKVPDNFEIVQGSEYPKGASINGNTIMWSNQTIDTNKTKFTFKIKVKDNYFGNVTNGTDYMNQKGEVNTNTEATISYTNPQNNDYMVQRFEVPLVNVPNSYNLNLQNKTVLYGDRVKLSNLIKNINIKYGPQDGYTYTWTDDKGHKIVLDNQNKNELSGNNFDKDSKEYGIIMRDDTKYTLEVTNKNIPNFSIKSSGEVTVIKPKIQITKKVVDGNGNEINSDGLFSFNLSQEYKEKIPVSVYKQSWNLDIKKNSPFIIKDVVRGVYSFRERDYQGYKFKSLEINGEEIDLNNYKFTINTEDDKLVVNGKVIDSKNPIINIEVTDSVNDIEFSNSSTVKINDFNSLN